MPGRERVLLAAVGAAAIAIVLLLTAATLLRPSGRSIEHQLDERTVNATFRCRRFGVLEISHAAVNTADMPSALPRGTVVFNCVIRGQEVRGWAGNCTGLTPGGEPDVIRARTKDGHISEGRPCGDYARL